MIFPRNRRQSLIIAALLCLAIVAPVLVMRSFADGSLAGSVSDDVEDEFWDDEFIEEEYFEDFPEDFFPDDGEGGTYFIPSDFDEKEDFDPQDFYSSMEDALDEQRDQEEEDEAERERIADLFRDQPRSSFGEEEDLTEVEQEEIERIRRLFQDQPRNQSSAISAPLTPEEEAERDRIRALFFDQEGQGRPEENLSSEDLAERERIRRLFQDQPRGSAGTGRPVGGCDRRGFLVLFDDDDLFCSDSGWTFPGLWGGDCPISACILKAGGGDGITESSFGRSVLSGQE